MAKTNTQLTGTDFKLIQMKQRSTYSLYEKT